MPAEPPTADRTLDVRAIDGQPFGDIMAALRSLEDDERLVIVADFEPEPLYGVLEDRGFTHEPREVDGTYHVLVERA